MYISLVHVCVCMLVICMYVCVCTCMLVCVCDICVCMGVYAGLLFQMYVYICLRVSTYKCMCPCLYSSWRPCRCMKYVCVRSVVKWPNKDTYATRPAQIVTYRGRNHMLATDSSVLISLSPYYGMRKHRMLTRGFGSIFLGTAAGLAGSGAFWYPRSTKRIGGIEDHGSCTYRKRR